MLRWPILASPTTVSVSKQRGLARVEGLTMPFVPQNFQDQNAGNPVRAAWLNNVDEMVNGALGGTPTVPAVQAALGIFPPINYFPIIPAELALTGITFNTNYPYGNLLRYGIVANNPTAATLNTALLKALLAFNIPNGPTGLIYSPNTGATGTPDIYYFNAPVLVRDNVVLDLMGTQWNWSFTPPSNNSYDSIGCLWMMRHV